MTNGLRKNLVPALVGVAIGVLAVFVVGLSLKLLRIGPALDPPMCDALVKISLGKDATGKPKIFADPDPVCLAIGRPLNWEIADQPEARDATIEIKFKPQNGIKGPFPYDSANGDNDDEGLYTHEGHGRVNSNRATRNDRWPYSVKYTVTATGTVIAETPDPVVCIRD